MTISEMIDGVGLSFLLSGDAFGCSNRPTNFSSPTSYSTPMKIACVIAFSCDGGGIDVYDLEEFIKSFSFFGSFFKHES